MHEAIASGQYAIHTTRAKEASYSLGVASSQVCAHLDDQNHYIHECLSWLVVVLKILILNLIFQIYWKRRWYYYKYLESQKSAKKARWGFFGLRANIGWNDSKTERHRM